MQTGTPPSECESASGAFSAKHCDPAPPVGHRNDSRVTQEPQHSACPVPEPVKKDMDGFTPDYQLGARRRTAGRGSDGRRGLTGSGTSERAARTTGPAGEGWRSPSGTARSAGLPRPVPRRAPRTTRTAGSEDAVVIAVALVVVPQDYGAGKEYDRQDEHDPGDNHHPRCGRVEPGWLGPRRRRGRRSCGDGSRRGRGFGCFAHALRILPRPITAITRSGNKLAVNPDAAVRCRFPKRSPALSRTPGY
jgi:hypothetical protein